MIKWQNKLLVVGSVAYDDITTSFAVRSRMLGGSATYTSVAASPFTQAHVVGVVGNDFREEDQTVFTHHGVNTTGLERDTTGDTMRWGGSYHTDMNERTTRFTHLNVFERFDPQIRGAMQHIKFVFLGNIDPTLQLRVLQQMSSPHFVAMDTMNFWIQGPQRAKVLEVLSKVNAVLINDEEGRLLTDERTPLRIGQGVQRLGPKIVVLKRGEHGAFLFNEDETFYIPAYPLEIVVDPTGAGDSFAGGFMGMLAQIYAQSGKTSKTHLRRAMLAGSITASLCVEGFGLEGIYDMKLDVIQNRSKVFTRMTCCPDLNL